MRGGLATADRLVKGYRPHLSVPGLYGFSGQYAPGFTWEQIAHLRRFPNGRLSIAYDTHLLAALRPLGYTLRIASSPAATIIPSPCCMMRLVPCLRPFRWMPRTHSSRPFASYPILLLLRPLVLAHPHKEAVAMKRISVDFNTIDSEPIDLVKLGQVGTPNGDALPPLEPGERVIVYDEELELEATICYDAEHHFWLAAPDWVTRQDYVTTSA